MSLELLPKCHKYSVVPVSYSDHCVVEWIIGTKERSKCFSWGQWKFNSNLLGDEAFVDKVKEIIGKIVREGANETGLQWELAKQEIKIKALGRATILRHEERLQERQLKDIIGKLLAQQCEGPCTCIEDVRKTKQNLELIEKKRYRGALVRAIAAELAAGETPTKRALVMEKAHAGRNDSQAIEWAGKFANDIDNIQRAFFEHYLALFAEVVEWI